VLVDTSVWSLALRRRAPAHPAVDELRRLIVAGRATLIGPIRQEVLSGIRDPRMFEALRERLAAFDDEPLGTADFVRAAEFFNRCLARGLQGSNTGFLICAACERHGMPLFTADDDFRRFARVLPIKLHRIAPA